MNVQRAERAEQRAGVFGGMQMYHEEQALALPCANLLALPSDRAAFDSTP